MIACRGAPRPATTLIAPWWLNTERPCSSKLSQRRDSFVQRGDRSQRRATEDCNGFLGGLCGQYSPPSPPFYGRTPWPSCSSFSSVLKKPNPATGSVLSPRRPEAAEGHGGLQRLFGGPVRTVLAAKPPQRLLSYSVALLFLIFLRVIETEPSDGIRSFTAETGGSGGPRRTANSQRGLGGTSCPPNPLKGCFVLRGPPRTSGLRVEENRTRAEQHGT